MPEVFVAREEELLPGGRILIRAERTEIGVFNVDGEYVALRNRCPHLAGPICRGKLKSTMVPSKPGEFVLGLEGRVLECPWHRWEFDITSGQLVVEDARYQLERYPVRNRDGAIYVTVDEQRRLEVHGEQHN
jgi:nitrite reductase/ring-hydroxylating ferredoxin subunit